MRNWRVFLFIGIWLALIGAAMRIDVPVARWVDLHRPIDPIKHWWWAFRAIGIFYTTLGIGAALAIFHRWRWWATALVCFSGVASGINYVLKWVFGRHRPVAHQYGAFEFHPFHNGLYSLIHAERDLSMPSGDVSLAFSTVAALCICLPRWRVLWVLLGLIVMFQRILCDAHYVSDTVAGAGLGVLCALFVRSLIPGPRDPRQHGFETLAANAKFSGTTTSSMGHIQ